MPTPDYVLELRRHYGRGRLLLPGVDAVVLRTDLEPGRTHLLLTRRTDTGAWALPAGIVEPDEQPATTILRELIEETHVVARADRLVLLTTDPVLTYPNGDVCQFVSMTYRCTYLDGDAQVGDDESTEVSWFATDDLPAELGPREHRRIACALSDRPECVFDQ